MKTDFFTVSLLAGLVAAGPIAIRQLGGGNSVSINAKEYSTGGCKPIIFFFARGSAEIGTMGSIGPPTGQGLKSAFGAGNVAVEGISYAAALGTNAIPGGADPAGITAMKNLLNGAASKCPTSILVAGGYSQGAALTHRAIENLSEDVKARIAGVDNGQIPNFPKDKLLIICNSGDAICQGILSILPAHLDYVRKAPEAVTFLTGKIKAAQGSGAVSDVKGGAVPGVDAGEDGKEDAGEDRKGDAGEDGKEDAGEDGKGDAGEDRKEDAGEDGKGDAAESSKGWPSFLSFLNN
ncbi:cutinase precursor [Drepanopeziza brunnea f. sp. 'multigermtubi' MB_m1]|uniref:Cutinase n=1 Tax=Marssonina brunnea f. sp. multigermtubi (strain MB_m1) TaxID=1072389 RepID=K1X9E7_MARBU|nr:cutinase precursor [Drepanopeziza brunnea f. sp. 'multigermtubi' MB_m1]EKD17368.1 cutinase precursor [Drepanopeziza brunnea f. sp. 'multigermtubi' MB_m1]